MSAHKDVIVIGGGAAGIAASVRAAERHKNVLLIEKNDKPGRKILASGNGRCNLMNSGKPRYFGDPSFAGKVLLKCPAETLKHFFHHYGLILSEETDGRIYPISYQSASVVSILKSAIHTSGVQLVTRTAVTDASFNGRLFTLLTSSGALYKSEKLIIACGGAAQSKLGGTSDGYRLLESFGHTIIPPKPALVPLETDQKSISGLSGIRVRCKVTLISGSRILHEEEGEVLFTDYGVSGICIMQCARFLSGEQAYVELNLLHRAFENHEQAVYEIGRRKALYADLSPVSLLYGIVAEKLSYAIMKQAGIPMRGETCSDLTDRDILNIVDTSYRYRIEITGTRGIDNAQVTSGGAVCDEFDPYTMRSMIVQGLYAAGEVLNVDGDCGGFNLMFAFSTGLIAGDAV